LTGLATKIMCCQSARPIHAAIVRIGAKQEGIVRHERTIDTEWPEMKALLAAKLAARG
jgi:hypothetical protein